MPPAGLDAAAILTTLPEGFALGELLHFPEVAVAGRNASAVMTTLRRLGAEVAKEDAALELAGRLVVAPPRCERIEVTLTPTRGAPGAGTAWHEPLTLPMALVVWEESPRHVVGVLPALRLAVTGKSVEAVRERAVAAAKRVATRAGGLRDLRWWASRHRRSAVSLRETRVEASRPTAVARARAEAEEEEAEGRDKPVVEQVTTDLAARSGEPVHEADAAVRALADLLRARPQQPGRSVLLVGPSGVGKTAAIRELARRRGAFDLADAAFRATDGSRLVAGMTGFGAWQQRCAKLAAEVKKEGSVLVLGNLVELLQAGRHEGNAMGIASFFRPMIARGSCGRRSAMEAAAG